MPIKKENINNRLRIESPYYLKERFFYNEYSGQLTWKILFPGKFAGTKCKPGKNYQAEFIKIALERLDFKAHRICWIIYYDRKIKTGHVIDHINGNPLDNRIVNLRECLNNQNCMNSKTPKSSSTGFKGVSKCGNKYRSYITKNKKQIHLGLFDTLLDAHEAYTQSAVKLFGEFACINR